MKWTERISRISICRIDTSRRATIHSMYYQMSTPLHCCKKVCNNIGLFEIAVLVFFDIKSVGGKTKKQRDTDLSQMSKPTAPARNSIVEISEAYQMYLLCYTIRRYIIKEETADQLGQYYYGNKYVVTRYIWIDNMGKLDVYKKN